MAWTKLSEPIKVDFGKEGNEALLKYVEEHLDDLISGHKDLFDTKLPEWRRIYEGIPKEKTREWPWKNASNLVIQIIGSYVDQLLARVMSAIHQTSPLWVLGLAGTWDSSEQGEEKRRVCEEYLNLIGLEPTQLDMYRNEYELFHDSIKYGLSVMYHPFEEQWEEVVAGYSDSELVSSKRMLSSGPKLNKLAYEHFLITPKAKTIESAEFKVVKSPMTWYELESCVYNQIYDKVDAEKLKNHPDSSSDVNKTAREQDSSRTVNSRSNATWDIYTCWFPFIWNNKKYRIIFSYHKGTKTVLRKIFNWYPDNEEPFTAARLGYDGDSIRGRGYVQLLKDYQAETSTQHNQSNDAGTLANTSIYRVDPSSKLDANVSIFPSSVLPLREGELEVYQMGRTSPDTIQLQELTLSLAKERAGVDAPTSGMGSGVTNPKKNVYSSMGTLAVLQEKNSRTAINVTDYRYSHMKMGRFFLKVLAVFGPGDIANTLGSDKELLMSALKEVEKGRLTIPVRAATASMNKEVEKQNDMLLSQVMRQHYMWVGSILQNLPNAPEHMREYIVNTIAASDMLMRHILRNFGHDDVSRFVPEPEIVKKLKEQMSGKQPAGGPKVNGVSGTNLQEQGRSAEVLSQQGGPEIPGIPQESAAGGNQTFNV